MKKAIPLALSLFFLATALPAQVTTNFVFARQLGGASNDLGRSVIADPAGNVYTIGYFEGSGDFDPGPGVMTLNSLGGDDIFIQQLDPAGNLVWVRQIGGAGIDHGMDIDRDPLGNIFATGYFQGMVDFDPGPGMFNLTSFNNSADAFILKLDPNGNFLFAGQLGGMGDDFGFRGVFDPVSNQYINTGWFNGTADFDPGAGTLNLMTGGSEDIFVAGFTNMGNVNFARGMGGPSFDEGLDVTVDGSGNIHVTGFFNGTADFDPGPGVINLVSAGQFDIFLSKLNPMGNLIWARQVGGVDFDQGRSLEVDAAGNIFVTGFFQGTVDFDPGAGAFNLSSTAGTFDIFILKMDAAGNFTWVRQLTNPGGEEAFGIDVDVFGNPYVTGYFFGTTDFDPGPGTFNLTSNGNSDFFFLRLTSAGDFSWAHHIGGTGSDAGYGLYVDQFGNIYGTGRFQNTVDFNPAAAVFNMTAAGASDVYVMKLNQSGQLPLTLLDFRGAFRNRQVHLQWKTVAEQSTSHFEIERSADGREFNKIGMINAAGNAAAELNYTSLDPLPLPHINYYRLRMVDIDGRYSFSSIIMLKNPGQPIRIFPSPVKDILVIQAQGAGNAVLRVTDASGRVVREKRIVLNGNMQHTIDLHVLPAGMYHLMLDDGTGVMVEKFIKY